MAAPKKPTKIQFNFFETACASSVNAIGQWKDPNDISHTKDTLDYYIWLAKIAEKGKITSIFFSDLYGGHEVYNNSKDAQYLAGSQVARLDPVTVISAMAAVSKSVGFGVTGSISCIPPYILARTWSSLDHLTKGRMAWNVVTSFSKSSATALGMEDLLAHDERYAAAEEYMEIVYSLWEKSWEDGAQKWQANPEMAYDPSKIHKANTTRWKESIKPIPRHSAHPSFFKQAHQKAGIEFGGKHAEAIFCAHSTIAATKAYTTSVRASAALRGRDPTSIKFFLSAMIFVAPTLAEARAKFALAKSLCSTQGGLARFSDFTNTDMSVYPSNQPFNFSSGGGENAIHGAIEGMRVVSELNDITPEDVGEMLALGGMGPRPIGTPEMVADELIKWAEEGDIQGFNLASVVLPGSWDDIVELLVPELQRRGVYWDDYPVVGGCLRENINKGMGGRGLDERHPGRRV